MKNLTQKKKKCPFCNNKIKENTLSGMFTYIIGRLNWRKNDLETTYQGYSQGYLDLLGLDEQSLINLTLRDKQIDLVRDTTDMTMYSALLLNSRINGDLFGEDALNIVTFDGFPIKIYQKQKILLFNEFPNFLMPEFILCISEIDVDLNEIQNLIMRMLNILFTQKDSLKNITKKT